MQNKHQLQLKNACSLVGWGLVPNFTLILKWFPPIENI